MSHKKNICFISPFIGPLLDSNDNRGTGGAERQFYLFGKELAKRGWKVSYILKKEKKDLVPAWPNWCKAFPVNFNYLGSSKLNLLPGIIEFWRAMLLSRARWHVVKTPSFLLLPMIIFGKFFRRKIVFWSQMDHDSERKRESVSDGCSKIQNYCLPKVDLIVSQTENQARNYQQNLELKTNVVRSIASKDYENDLPEMKDYILWVANSLSKKRQEVFIELAKLLPGYKFVMAMNVGCQERFNAASEVAKGIENLTFLGTIKPTETQKWFNGASIYVHTASKEGFPNTYLQAWLGQTPVISLNIDPDNIIEKYGLGIVAESDKVKSCHEDPRSLALLLVPFVKRLLSDDCLRNQIVKTGFDYVQKNHSPEVVVDILGKVLLENDN